MSDATLDHVSTDRTHQMNLVLKTAYSAFVADVAPLLPIDPGPVVIWGDRIFSRVAPGHYTEVIPTIVVTTEEREGIRARLRAWSEL